MTDPAITAQLSQQEDNEEFRNRPLDETQADLGSRECLRNEEKLAYYPAETDVSIRPGWFYHEEEDDQVRSFENLKEIYLSSVGGNTTLLLNLPPMKNGKLHQTDVNNVKMLGDFIRSTFKDNLADIAEITTVPEKDAEGKNADLLRVDDYENVFRNKAGDRELTIHLQWTEKKKFQASGNKTIFLASQLKQEKTAQFSLSMMDLLQQTVSHILVIFLTRVIKDLIPRYKTMKGYKVLRKAGWDTHGLPVELEVEKQLGISGKPQIEDYGVEPFIKKCKDSVFTYESLWRKMSDRVGYWADMDNPYVTYHNDYIESVWWALKQIWDKGLLYKGHKIVPYCPRCGTALSSHEVAQGYKDVKETSCICRFKVVGKDNEYFLAWTTTPWTLPSNVALCVNAAEEYSNG